MAFWELFKFRTSEIEPLKTRAGNQGRGRQGSDHEDLVRAAQRSDEGLEAEVTDGHRRSH